MAKKPILTELNDFIKGATAIYSLSPSDLGLLVHGGLNLLQNLPASKDAVFEYFSIFFNASVAGYVQLVEVNDKKYAPQQWEEADFVINFGPISLNRESRTGVIHMKFQLEKYTMHSIS